MNKENVYRTIYKYKYDNRMTIPVFNNGETFGYMKPITYSYSVEYVSLICKWRAENEKAFANRFVGTEEKTRNWIEKVLLPRKDRILFMIHAEDNTAIGHIGLSTFNFENNSCEIDNVVRGIKNGFNGIMTAATKSLIKWGRLVLGVHDIYLRVLSDNEDAIKFYMNMGFREQSRIPLYKEEYEGLTVWEYKENETREPDRFYIYMKK